MAILLSVITGALALLTGLVLTLSRRRLREQERQRQMAEAEFAAILSERNRLAREIHDTLAQGLTATSVQLRLAKRHANGASEVFTRHLDTALSLVQDSLREARNSIWNMRAHVLENGDLAGALRGILHQMADGTEIVGQLHVTGRVRRLPPVVENNVLRAGQEAIANAVRHSEAKRVDVTLEFEEKQFHLRVVDDGRGFDPERPPSGDGGFGLVGMRERVAELKGELNIRSAPGQGAEIVLTIPLSGD
jgi:signal transduction histidine kinase